MLEINKGNSLCDEGRDSASLTHTCANTFLICRSHIKYNSKKKYFNRKYSSKSCYRQLARLQCGVKLDERYRVQILSLIFGVTANNSKINLSFFQLGKRKKYFSSKLFKQNISVFHAVVPYFSNLNTRKSAHGLEVGSGLHIWSSPRDV